MQMFYRGSQLENQSEPLVIKNEETPTVAEMFNTLSIKYGVSKELADRIIWCESRWNKDARNYNAAVGVDIGYWQLNSFYWKDKMLSLGWDIYDPIDNLEAGFWLLSKEGSTPWNWSKHCWNK